MNLRQRKIFHISTLYRRNEKENDDKKRTVCGYGYYKYTLITATTIIITATV